jgi:hypothetical protein
LITEDTVKGLESARYYSRGQKHIFHQEGDDEDRLMKTESGGASLEEVETEEEGLRATG